MTVGRRWFWGGVTLGQLRGGPWSDSELAPTTADQPAAIIFTTGSTGPPKGVLYSHGNFDAQVEQIRDFYGIQPGEVDLPAFPLFGLFNCAMGVTAVIPDMDPSRPAAVDPTKIIEAAADWNVTQAFGSPAIWDRVGRYCETHAVRLPTVRRVLSAGAPVPAEVLRRMKACIHPEGDIHTPYGATEALPVASIAASEVLGARPDVSSPLPLGEGQGVRAPETTLEREVPVSQPALTLALSQRERGLSQIGAGVCVGRTFSGIHWKVIRIVDGPIPSLDVAEELPVGEIGELIVRGPQVTRQYVTRVEWNARAKDCRRGRSLASDGRLGLPGPDGPLLVLRPGGPSRVHCLRDRCIRFVARRSSTSIPTSAAVRWSALGRRGVSGRSSFWSRMRAECRRAARPETRCWRKSGNWPPPTR